MQLTFTCPHCDTTLEAEGSLSGTRVPCTECGTDVHVPSRFIGPGVTIGGFRIKKLIGRGGMGEVYLATQLSLRRDVALKILPAQFTMQKSLVERFLREVRMAARMQHPNIVTAYAAGEDEGVYYMAMAFVKGETLEERMRRQGLQNEQEALELVRTISVALQFAWGDHHLLHRDIKPANIMIDNRGQAKLLDMGLSKSMDDIVGVTQVAMVMGTPNYVSPEQAEGRDSIDFRADMYALGATLYHMLTGNMPFEGNSMSDTLRKQSTEALPDPRDFNEAISDPCVQLLGLLLAKDPDRRHPDWESLTADIDRVLAGQAPERAHPPEGVSTLQARGTACDGMASAGSSQRIVLSHEEAERLHDSGQLGHHHHPSPLNRKPLWLSLGLGSALLALLVGTLWVINRPEAVVEAPPIEDPEIPTPPPDVIESPTKKPAEERRLAVEKKVDESIAYTLEHPEDYPGAVQRFMEALILAEGTSSEQRVRDAMTAYEASRQERIDQALAALVEQAETQYTDGDATASIAAIQAMTGPFTDETTAARERWVEHFRAREQGYAAEQERLKTESLDRLRVRLAETASLLLRRQYDEARSRLEEIKTDTVLNRVAAERDGASALLGNLIEMPALVFESFRDDIGKEQVIYFKTGPETLRIMDVKVVQIWADRKIDLGGGNFASSQRRFTVEHLSPREKARRISRSRQSAGELMLGLLAVEMMDPAMALRYFEQSDNLLNGVFAELVREVYPGMKEPVEATLLPDGGTASVGAETAAPPGMTALSPPDERGAMTALRAMLSVAGLQVPEDDVEGLVDAARKKSFGRALVTSLRSRAEDFEQRFKDTRASETYRPLLDVLIRVVPDKPLFATQQEVEDALAKVHRDNSRIAKFKPRWVLHPYGLTLDLANELDLVNIQALAGLPVVDLNLTKTSVTDISPLATMPLENLVLDYCKIADLGPLKGQMLRSLRYRNAFNVRDLRPLAGMPLKDLTLTSPTISAVRELRGLPLETLVLQHCEVTDLRALAGMPLKTLDVQGMYVSDFSVLKEMNTLENLKVYSRNLKEPLPLTHMLAIPNLKTIGGMKSQLARMVETEELLDDFAEKKFDAALHRIATQRARIQSAPAFQPWVEHLNRYEEVYIPMTRELMRMTTTGGGMSIPETALTHNGHSYALCLVPMKWEEAREFASGFGGYLVCLTSETEADWFQKNLHPAGRGVWLGASDDRGEGQWRWLSGEPFKFNKWFGGRPDNLEGNEDWLISDGNYQGWNDVGPETGGPAIFVMEWDR